MVITRYTSAVPEPVSISFSVRSRAVKYYNYDDILVTAGSEHTLAGFDLLGIVEEDRALSDNGRPHLMRSNLLRKPPLSIGPSLLS